MSKLSTTRSNIILMYLSILKTNFLKVKSMSFSEENDYFKVRDWESKSNRQKDKVGLQKETSTYSASLH